MPKIIEITIANPTNPSNPWVFIAAASLFGGQKTKIGMGKAGQSPMRSSSFRQN